MRKLILFIFLLILPVLSFGQNGNGETKPFIIQGQLSNVPEKQISLQFRDDDKFVNIEISLNDDGKFYLKSNQITKPVMATLGKNRSILSYIYVAPGYNLMLTGDGKDYRSFASSKKIEGYGAAANNYLFMRDAVMMKQKNDKEWFQMNATALLAYADRQEKICDSIVRIVFNKKVAPDNYYSYFRKKTVLNIKFDRLSYLVNHAIDDKNFNYDQANAYVVNNFEPGIKNFNYNPASDFLNKPLKPGILNNLFNKDYDVSDSYRILMYNYYFIFLYEQQKRRDSTVLEKKRYNIDFVKLVANDYKGDLREKVLYSRIYTTIQYARSFEELNDYKKAFPKYIDQIPGKDKKDNIAKLYASKEAELLKTAIGRPAPLFTAEDSSGKKYSLAYLKGKVVYVDLWASWCGPCRAETPYLKKIFEKYKGDNRIVIMSVAVLDMHDKWKTAVTEDKPTWLQLFDTDGSVQNAYVATSIPKFVLIDKQGNIVNLDASDPQSGAVLEKLLDAEIAKN